MRCGRDQDGQRRRLGGGARGARRRLGLGIERQQKGGRLAAKPEAARQRRGRDSGDKRGAKSTHHGHPHSLRSEEHTSELQSLMRISYAVFCLKKKRNKNKENNTIENTVKNNNT